MDPPFPAPAGRRWVFCKCFKHWRTGKLVYPKTAECFAFLVKSPLTNVVEPPVARPGVLHKSTQHPST